MMTLWWPRGGTAPLHASRVPALLAAAHQAAHGQRVDCSNGTQQRTSWSRCCCPRQWLPAPPHSSGALMAASCLLAASTASRAGAHKSTKAAAPGSKVARVAAARLASDTAAETGCVYCKRPPPSVNTVLPMLQMLRMRATNAEHACAPCRRMRCELAYRPAASRELLGTCI